MMRIGLAVQILVVRLQIVWLRGLLAELGYPPLEPTFPDADNTSAFQIVVNPIFHECTKHIEIDCHSIREAYDNRKGVISRNNSTFDRTERNIHKYPLLINESLSIVSSLKCSEQIFHGPFDMVFEK
ncbi:uncharacterized protein LOC111395267 [Olea europaea var. sylvestris]|uniref:uncharacterized protein LOC111395267 n=1 Tax=Olea europaea var. sylvestris TaxID=158386 RepID=UPI000C1D6C0E|nr:uncharacterized protein LOC111395267 [Olea europaea var. sylvestris]